MRLRNPLFVPADSERKISKALSCGADAIILDLEDSVASNAKHSARVAASAVLASAPDRPEIWVRVNPRDTEWYLSDLAALVPSRPTAVVLPKCAGPCDLMALDHHLEALEIASGLPAGGISVLALVTETALSLAHMNYVGVTSRLRALLFGAEDLAADLGISPRDSSGGYTAPLAAARSSLLFAAAQASVPALDTPWTDLKDPAGLQGESAAAARDGFAGKLCIHPDQVAPVEKAFTPTLERVRWAEAVRNLFASNPGAGALSLNGRMIDRPHLRLAERILGASSSQNDQSRAEQ